MRLPSRRGVLHLAGILVLVALVAPFVVFAVPQVVGAEASHVVLSGSMAPAISQGDVVIVNDVDPARIGEGDVITFSRRGEQITTTHRVVEVYEEGNYYGFETKGDANEEPDPDIILDRAVEGRVMVVIPYIGHVILFATTSVGRVVFLGVPLGLLVLLEGRKLLGAVRGDEDGEATATAESDRGPLDDEETGLSVGDESGTREDTATIGISVNELRLAVPVSLLFAAYALWVLYRQWTGVLQPSPVAVTVAVGATLGFLMLAGLYVSSGDRETADTGEPPAHHGHVPAVPGTSAGGTWPPFSENGEGSTDVVSVDHRASDAGNGTAGRGPSGRLAANGPEAVDGDAREGNGSAGSDERATDGTRTDDPAVDDPDWWDGRGDEGGREDA